VVCGVVVVVVVGVVVVVVVVGVWLCRSRLYRLSWRNRHVYSRNKLTVCSSGLWCSSCSCSSSSSCSCSSGVAV